MNIADMNEGMIRTFLLAFSAKIKSTQRGKYYFQMNTTALNCALKCSRLNVYKNCQFLTFKPPCINWQGKSRYSLLRVTHLWLVNLHAHSRKKIVVNSCLSYCFAAQYVFFSFLFIFACYFGVYKLTRKL